MTTISDIAEVLTTIGIAFRTTYSESEIALYYDFLKQYDKRVVKDATKELIRKCTFVPKISDFLNYCEEAKKNQKFGILEYMLLNGYFKQGEFGELCPEQEQLNYQKANRWLQNKNIPQWFIQDMEEYKEKMQQDKLINESVKLIE